MYTMLSILYSSLTAFVHLIKKKNTHMIQFLVLPRFGVECFPTECVSLPAMLPSHVHNRCSPSAFSSKPSRRWVVVLSYFLSSNIKLSSLIRNIFAQLLFYYFEANNSYVTHSSRNLLENMFLCYSDSLHIQS